MSAGISGMRNDASRFGRTCRSKHSSTSSSSPFPARAAGCHSGESFFAMSRWPGVRRKAHVLRPGCGGEDSRRVVSRHGCQLCLLFIGGRRSSLAQQRGTESAVLGGDQACLGNNLKFDFEGSMIEPIERVFRAFGATQVPYLQVYGAAPLTSALLLIREWSRR